MSKPPPTREEVRELERNLRHLTCAELEQWLESGKACSILDVRTEGEWLAHRIKGAHLVPLHRLQERLDEVLALPGPLVVHCEHGMRSFDASLFLSWQGRSDVYNLEEGLASYQGPQDRGRPPG